MVFFKIFSSIPFQRLNLFLMPMLVMIHPSQPHVVEENAMHFRQGVKTVSITEKDFGRRHVYRKQSENNYGLIQNDDQPLFTYGQITSLPLIICAINVFCSIAADVFIKMVCTQLCYPLFLHFIQTCTVLFVLKDERCLSFKNDLFFYFMHLVHIRHA